jgi:hypothetical protein
VRRETAGLEGPAIILLSSSRMDSAHLLSYFRADDKRVSWVMIDASVLLYNVKNATMLYDAMNAVRRMLY